jgi:hypothetical protein
MSEDTTENNVVAFPTAKSTTRSPKAPKVSKGNSSVKGTLFRLGNTPLDKQSVMEEPEFLANAKMVDLLNVLMGNIFSMIEKNVACNTNRCMLLSLLLHQLSLNAQYDETTD